MNEEDNNPISATNADSPTKSDTSNTYRLFIDAIKVDLILTNQLSKVLIKPKFIQAHS